MRIESKGSNVLIQPRIIIERAQADNKGGIEWERNTRQSPETTRGGSLILM